MTDSPANPSTPSRWANKAYPSRRPHKKNCDVCGTYYEGRSPWTCGDKCRYALAIQRRGRPLNFKGGRINHQGYVRLWMPTYKWGTTAKGYVLEHRYLMEQHLGRQLDRWEHVHHINGVRSDNRLENLAVVMNNKHHGAVTCPNCGCGFLIH